MSLIFMLIKKKSYFLKKLFTYNFCWFLCEFITLFFFLPGSGSTFSEVDPDPKQCLFPIKISLFPPTINYKKETSLIIIRNKIERCGQIPPIKCLTRTDQKTSHTTWTWNIKIRVICRYNPNNKFKVRVVWHVFLNVRVQHFDLSDISASFDFFLISFEFGKNVISKISGRLLIGQNDSSVVLLLVDICIGYKKGRNDLTDTIGG